MNILILEAYDGGSHAQFLDGLTAHSGHLYARLGLAARKWKWRMRGSALYFARQVPQTLRQAGWEPAHVDLILTSDMTSVSDLRALLPAGLRAKPIVCYFHENQLTYPLPDEAERDYQYAFTHIASCLAADAVWFNSPFHRDSFLEAVERLLGRMSDYVPQEIAEDIRRKSTIMPLGLAADLFALKRPAGGACGGPVLLWNHRWEYDKNPEDFFETLFALAADGADFRLIVAGQSFRKSPAIFATARKILAGRIDHFGYVPSRQGYLDCLARADVAVSTARHDFFGLAAAEAIAAGCYPLLPRRLNYPELIPPDRQAEHLFDTLRQLRETLLRLCRRGVPAETGALRNHLLPLRWSNLIGSYDAALARAADGENIPTSTRLHRG
ncbi:MAG: DUF3524 domain-containing protein [Sedimentisphaerales bacterium]|nr:DUF3524 domain-containing protein [Sedimentisphaerales bacterium]